TVDRYYGGWYQCGQFSFDKSLFTADDSYHIFIYSGIDGQFRDFAPGLIYKSTTSTFGGGGTIFGLFDTLSAWGYDVVGDRGSLQALALDKTANFECGEDYLTLTRWSTTSDDMITYFYNSNTNRWTSVTVPDNHTTDGIKTEHIYLHRGYPEQETIFYSAIKDTIIKVDFADGTYAGSRVRGVLGFTTSEARSVLFDGLNGASYEADFEFDRFGLGLYSGVFCDTSDDTWYGYSTLFGNLRPLATSEEPYYVLDTGYIGMVTVNYPEKVYAYNGLSDSWVGLVPEGDYYSALLGKKTIILIRDDRVYAFDPEGDPTGVDDYPGPQPARFELSQNYPNPFNPVTTIAYSMDRQGDVAITIYNLLGQKVKKLVDENKTAGEYQVVWDGTNDDGRAVASGVYFYRIKAGEEVEARKMLLLK
ncbi:MAG: T9SS type A sorting domain-containing protein, partial [FCB group bacterium]|nr:T9SS type A sorting domain-containing protein [FCB group bacterium]